MNILLKIGAGGEYWSFVSMLQVFDLGPDEKIKSAIDVEIITATIRKFTPYCPDQNRKSEDIVRTNEALGAFDAGRNVGDRVTETMS
jgi:hypothetical protein